MRLKRRNGFANPGGFDYEAQLFRLGIGATGYIRDDPRNLRFAQPSMRYAIVRVRAWIAQRLAIAVRDDEPCSGYLQGLAVGDTRAMSAAAVAGVRSDRHDASDGDLRPAHHDDRGAGGVAGWPRGSMARGATRRLTAIYGQTLCGVSAALLYSVLAGLSVPTQRTLVMLCIAFAARASRRELSVGHAMGLALLVSCC